MSDDILVFHDDQVVDITRDNAAHAVVEDRGAGTAVWACDTARTDVADRVLRAVKIWKRMTWAQSRNPAFKPWGAWPCQSCAGDLRRAQ